MLKVTPSALAEIEVALEEYKAEIGRTNMTDSTQATYLLHADQFVRWLQDKFVPGERVANRTPRPRPA